MEERWNVDVAPFVVDGPVPPHLVVGRNREAASLRALVRAGRSVSLYGPRRYGKTSLLQKVAADARRLDRMPAVLVDLYGVLSHADLVIRLERAYREHALGPVRKAIDTVFSASQLGLSLAGVGIAVRFAQEPRTDPLPALHTLLDLPRRLHEGRGSPRVLVVFDEFQSIARIRDADALLRSHIQHQRDAASYLFAGSEPTLLQVLFSDPGRPFYGQAETRRLGRIDDEALAGAIRAGFDAGGRSAGEVLPLLLGLADGHPQRAMLLANCLWEATPRGFPAGEEEWLDARARARARTAFEHETRWDALTANQQRVLRAVTEFGSPHRVVAEHRLGLPRGTVGSTVEQLLALGVVERDQGRLRLVDPLFADWLRSRFGPAGD